jgi:ABC-2 type transport system ATP-binding protein
MQALKSQGTSIVYSTHLFEEAERLCDTITILDRGRVLASGSCDELVQRHGGASHVEARVGQRPENAELAAHWRDGRLSVDTTQPRRLVDHLLSIGSSVTELSVRGPGLEGVFMNLTGRGMRDF